MLVAELQTHHSMYMPSFIAAYIGTWYQFTIQIPADTKYISIGLMKKAGPPTPSERISKAQLRSMGSEIHHHKHLATWGSSSLMRTET